MAAQAQGEGADTNIVRAPKARFAPAVPCRTGCTIFLALPLLAFPSWQPAATFCHEKHGLGKSCYCHTQTCTTESQTPQKAYPPPLLRTQYFQPPV